MDVVIVQTGNDGPVGRVVDLLGRQRCQPGLDGDDSFFDADVHSVAVD